MHRIDGPGATIDNLFTEGDPAISVPATTVTGNWLNAIQEEIANAIEEAGIDLDKPDNTQLTEAIYLIAGQAAGWSTGDVKLTMKAAADAGWILCTDGTIGKTGSAGTTRANNDCEALFLLLWNNVSNAFAAVSGGRGASAAADWAAGKTIALTKMLGRALALGGAGASLTARTLGQTIGAETHTLLLDEIPSHFHVQHHTGSGASSQIQMGGGGAGATNSGIPTTAVGGSGAHNNMQPTAFLNAMIKL